MTTKKIDVYYYKNIDCGGTDVSTTDLSAGYFSNEYILLGKGKAVIELIEQDDRVVAAEKLEERKKKITADYVVAVEVIDGKIQELRSLTHQPERAEDMES